MMNFIPENQLKDLLSNEFDFLFILNMDGNIITANFAVNNVLKYSLNELKGKHFSAVYPDEYKVKSGMTMPLVIKGDITTCPYPFMKKDKGIIPVDTKFYFGWWNEENVIAVVSTNLSVEHFSKEVFFSIFNSSQVMMAIGSVDTGIIFNANHAFLENIGYSLDEVSGKTVKELNLFYDSEQIKKLLARSNGKDSVKGELTIRSKSGERIVCLFSFEQIKIQNNEYMLVAATNITQRKQMEERLKKLGNQQKLLANIAQLLNKSDNFDDIINVVLRLIGEHTNVSRVSIYENTPDEQYTTNTFEWCNEGIAGKKEALQRVSFENIPSWIKIINTEGHLSSTDIIELPQDIASVFNLFGIKSILLYPLYIQNRLWGFVGLDDCLHNRVWLEEEISLLKTVTGNITNALERKLYLNQFQNSEMRLRLALDGAREGMWDWDLQTDVIYFTNIGYEIIDQDLDESFGIGHKWQKFVHPDDWGWVSQLFIAHKNSKIDYFEATFRVLGKSGKEKWILNHGRIIERDEEGTATRAIGTLIDISKQKENEEQLKRLLATKDKLFSIIAHDLRGPVGSFMQVIELLTSNMEITPEMEDALLNDLKDMSKNTFYLLENLLNWSRSQRSEIVYNPGSIIINKLVNDNISLLSGTAGQKSIQIQFSANTNYTAYADYDMTNLVIRNLLSNAIKFTRTNGLIKIGLSEQDGFIEVEIADNGVGMSKETADKLFTDNQFHTTYGTNNEKGSGLGLVLCQDFVKRNGGNIRVESIKDEGSKFFFTLPSISKIITAV